MTSFLIHVLFISLIGTAAFLVVHEHERDARIAYVLKFSVVTIGGANNRISIGRFTWSLAMA